MRNGTPLPCVQAAGAGGGGLHSKHAEVSMAGSCEGQQQAHSCRAVGKRSKTDTQLPQRAAYLFRDWYRSSSSSSPAPSSSSAWASGRSASEA